MKICIMGSSHVGSLRLGWDIIKDQFPEYEITFFGAIGATIRHMKPIDGKLVPLNKALSESLAWTSGGLTEIEPAAYDAVVLYGVAFRVPRLKQGISKAVMQETMKDLASNGVTINIVKRLRTVTRQRLWIGVTPLEVAPDDQHDDGIFYPYEVLLGELQRFFPIRKVTFLLQPSETIGLDLRAPQRFGSGSLRLLPDKEGESRLHPDNEVKHMNAEFGRLWLLQNLPVIAMGAARGAHQ